MKVALMGGWNSDSGASFHTEELGKGLKEIGIDIIVFTFYKYAFHGTHLFGKDEDYVHRCFTVSSATPNNLEPVPFLTNDFDIFIVEDLGMLPKDLLGKIYNRIHKKAKTINVIHDGRLSKDPAFYQFEWDAIVCFDKRYCKFLKTVYDVKKIHIIPYPAHPIKSYNKEKAREELSLPMDKKIIFSFGPAAKLTADLVPKIARLQDEFPILYLTVTSDKEAIKSYKGFMEKGEVPIELREEVLDIKRLYKYLSASDVLLINKKDADNIVVSSTVYQCMGSMCPVLARDSNYVEMFDKEIMKFKDEEDLLNKIRIIFYDEVKGLESTVKDFLKKNSSIEIAKTYKKLFNEIGG